MSRILKALQDNGVDFVAGVPCSFLRPFFAASALLPEGSFVNAVREDHAISACAGAWLGGRMPAAAMQNSGLGYCLEVLSSLHLLYGIPLPMIVSDRGGDEDYEEHRNLGDRTRSLLELFDIPWRTGASGSEAEDARWAVETAQTMRRPTVLLIGRGVDR